MTEAISSGAAALERFQAAMDHVEEAQRELGRAAAELSSLVGGMTVWRKVSREYDRVHALWHALASFRERHGHKLELDGLAKQAAGVKAEGAEGGSNGAKELTP